MLRESTTVFRGKAPVSVDWESEAEESVKENEFVWYVGNIEVRLMIRATEPAEAKEKMNLQCMPIAYTLYM